MAPVGLAELQAAVDGDGRAQGVGGTGIGPSPIAETEKTKMSSSRTREVIAAGLRTKRLRIRRLWLSPTVLSVVPLLGATVVTSPSLSGRGARSSGLR